LIASYLCAPVEKIGRKERKIEREFFEKSLVENYPPRIFALRSKKEQQFFDLKLNFWLSFSESFLKKNLVEIKRLLPLQPQTSQHVK
jgi:hypothetical protein